MADGIVTFSTALDNSQLEKDLKQAERDLERLKDKAERNESGRNALAEQLEQARAAAAETAAEIERLANRLAELGELSLADPAGAEARAEVVTQEFQKQVELYDRQGAEIEKLEGELQKLEDKAKGYTAELEAESRHVAELGAEYANAYTRGLPGMQAALAQAEASFSKFFARIGKMAKKVFVFSVILSGLRAIKSLLGDALVENERFSASWANLKAVVQGIANFVAGVLAPVLTGFVNMVAAMLTTLARAVDAIFKTNIAASIESARNAAKATRAQTKATKALRQETDRATKSIMGFDEVNALSAETSAGAAEAIGDEAGAGGAEPDWNAFDVGKIDAKLAEIMTVVGAALLAVGAVLAFSGINIPLGITLMAIGALMVYTAYQEAWGELPAEVQSALVALLEVIAAFLVVIGVVLCLTGHVPIGIGFIIAGAAVFATAVALDWENLRGNVDGALNELLMLVGGFVAVIGVVLCVAGHLPLGIAAIIAGIAVFAVSEATMDRDRVPAEVQALVDTVMYILGPAIVVLGAILCAAGHPVLGIAAIIAGIAVLAVSAATIDPNAIPSDVKAMVTTILSIVSAALIVIGIILCVTGVGIPLGIACIVAGVASMVAAVSLNWNFLRDKVAEIWNGIVQFWNSHIAHIFTWEFWENLFKSMVNGLIGAINNGLNAFGNFINTIASGISNVLDWLGVKGWSFEISMPQIPYLAQGAVIPPNREFLAVLGDQANGRNLEAPEGLIRQIVREEAMSALLNAAPQDGDVILTLVMDGETIARAVSKGNASLARRGHISTQVSFA